MLPCDHLLLRVVAGSQSHLWSVNHNSYSQLKHCCDLVFPASSAAAAAAGHLVA